VNAWQLGQADGTSMNWKSSDITLLTLLRIRLGWTELPESSRGSMPISPCPVFSTLLVRSAGRWREGKALLVYEMYSVGTHIYHVSFIRDRRSLTPSRKFIPVDFWSPYIYMP